MAFVLSRSIALSLANFVILHGDFFKVEARPKEVIPVPGWFNNVEAFVMPNKQGPQSLEPSYINRQVETDDLLNSIRKMNKRNRKKILKKVAKKNQEEVKKTRKRGVSKTKKHKSKRRLKFLKSDINNDIRDSNLSQSKEKQSERKPVDIIVHIKMND